MDATTKHRRKDGRETVTTAFGRVYHWPDESGAHVRVKANGNQLWTWARRPSAVWPCSELARLDGIDVVLDSFGDLVELEVEGGDADDISGDELTAWLDDVAELAGLDR